MDINKDLFRRVKDRLHRTNSEIFLKFFPVNYYRKNVIQGIKRLSEPDAIISRKLTPIPKIVIEASNTCNLNCIMCKTLNSERPKGEMSLEMFKNVIKMIKEFRQNLLVIHTVGEPFMYSGLDSVFRICSENGIYLKITTNGLLLNKHFSLIEKYPSIIKHITFSIDGATKEIYEKIRRGGNFERLIANLDRIENYRDNKKIKLSLSCQACVSNDNFTEIPLFYKRFKKYFGIANIRFTFVSSSSAEGEGNLCYKNTKMNLRGLYRRNHPCKLLWGQIHILYDGKVSACCRDYDGELIVGDVKEDSIMNIWNGEKYRNLRKKHIKGDIDHLNPCSHCYGVDNVISSVFNNFLGYLFTRFLNKEDEFYLSRINKFLKFIVDIKDKKEDARSLKESLINIL